MMIKKVSSTIKMKILVAASIFFFLLGTSYAQNQAKADSLISILNRKDIDDSERLIILKGISTSVSDPDLRIKYSYELTQLANKLGDTELFGLGLRNAGVAFRRKGRLEESLDHLIRSAEIFKSIESDVELAKSYTEIGSTYTQNKDTRNSLLFKSKAIEVLRKTNNKRALAISLLNTGFSYYTIKKLDTALAYYNEAEPIFEELGFEIGKAYAIGNRALVFWKLGDLSIAKQDLFRAIKMLEPLGDRYGMADYYNQLGNIYLEQHQDEEAIQYTAIGLEMAKEEDLKEQVRDASMLLYQLHKRVGKYKEALDYQTQYIAYKDSIQNQETTQRLADLRTEYEVGQKQAEVDLLSIEKRNQQGLSIGLGLFLLLTSTFTLILFRNYKEKNRVNKLLEGQADLLRQQKKELEELNKTKDKFFSIISHDLRGPVSSLQEASQLIRHFVESDNKKDLLEITDLFSKSAERLSILLDNLLNWALQQQGNVPHKPEPISVQQIFSNIHETFDNMSEMKSIKLTSKVDKDVTLLADRNAAQTVFRNLVNNALKFTPEGGKVSIEASSAKGMAIIKVIDTGVGMTREKADGLFQLGDSKSTYGTSGEKGVGLGLQLVYEFIRMNEGSIKVSSTEGVGTTFTVKLPLFQEDRKKVENL